MKIQITNRQLWLDKVNTEITKILDERHRRNTAALELPWYKAIFADMEPSIYAYGDLYHLRSVKFALETEGTNEIWINSDELRAIL